MRIAIASGKGGTGKTTVAVNLAAVAAAEGHRVQLLDCDVEEPNCHLFLQPSEIRRRPINVAVPVIDQTRCNGCGQCADICRFNALACLPDDVMVFPELCHACGGCWLVCPERAIAQGIREIGVIEDSVTQGLRLTQGRLNVGEAQAPPAIARVLDQAGAADLTLVDAPPGTSCAAVAAVRGCDSVVLVTEPTPFGLHDLKLAVETLEVLGKPAGVVINRADIGDARVRHYCRRYGIPVLLEIPHDRRFAEAYSRGELLSATVPGARQLFHDLLARLLSRRIEMSA